MPFNHQKTQEFGTSSVVKSDRTPWNYIFFLHLFSKNSTVIDFDCEVELSVAMIEHYGTKTIAVDPILKQRHVLTKIADK